MEAVILLSDRLQALLAVLDRLRQAGRLDPAALVGVAGRPAGQSLLDFATGLNGVLRELQGSFENRDSVLIGDLLEYEVVPRLAALRSFAGSLA